MSVSFTTKMSSVYVFVPLDTILSYVLSNQPTKEDIQNDGRNLQNIA